MARTPRTPRRTRRHLIERTHSIDVRRLKRDSQIAPGETAITLCTVADGRSSKIRLADIERPVFGGVHTYFHCPYCDRRCDLSTHVRISPAGAAIALRSHRRTSLSQPGSAAATEAARTARADCGWHRSPSRTSRSGRDGPAICVRGARRCSESASTGGLFTPRWSTASIFRRATPCERNCSPAVAPGGRRKRCGSPARLPDYLPVSQFTTCDTPIDPHHFKGLGVSL